MSEKKLLPLFQWPEETFPNLCGSQKSGSLLRNKQEILPCAWCLFSSLSLKTFTVMGFLDMKLLAWVCTPACVSYCQGDSREWTLAGSEQIICKDMFASWNRFWAQTGRNKDDFGNYSWSLTLDCSISSRWNSKRDSKWKPESTSLGLANILPLLKPVMFSLL